MTVSQYLKTIQNKLAAGNATEHTHRSALRSLIESLAEKILAGDNAVENVRYTGPGEGGSEQGRVWINR